MWTLKSFCGSILPFTKVVFSGSSRCLSRGVGAYCIASSPQKSILETIILDKGHIRKIVSRSGHQKNAILHLSSNGVLKGLRCTASTPTVVGDYDIDAAIFSLFDQREAGNSIRNISKTLKVQEFARKNLNIPVHSCHAHAVVADCANDPRDMGAVAVVVKRIAGVIQRIEAVDTGRTLHLISIESGYGKAFGR